MIFSYDKYNRLERPVLYLANPDKKYYGTIHSTNLHTNLYFNSISELTFTSHKYINGIETNNYDENKMLKLLPVGRQGMYCRSIINKEIL